MPASEVYRASPERGDHVLAHRLAAAAGRHLVAIRSGEPGVGARGDREANSLLLERLAHARPADKVLSEEAADDPARLDADRVWIIDPLDGTREFTEPGRRDWAVHVALWGAGALIAGAVALPALGTVLSTWRLPRIGTDPARTVVVSRSRPPALLPALLARWPAAVLPMGSAGAKTAAVLTGVATAYVHAGGQFEWDSAAPVAVAAACGLSVRRVHNLPLRYNQRDPVLPDLAICRPREAASLWRALDELAESANGDPVRTD
ncbi:inositol monophosphatase family protein [Kutzneria sp. NPDC051319]|uniref:inositol monophosphatase family protein n=1 Tax=Kutzneria sp. NPDC051319 TaxID=3155047 RepID=UPI00341CD2BD